jgi:hypothetical protein
MTSPRLPLPSEAEDGGDRIVVTPDTSTRVFGWGGAALGVVVGVLLAVTLDGAARLFGALPALAGLWLLVAQAERLTFDRSGVELRSPLRRRSLDWDEVTHASVSRRYARVQAGGAARRLGGLTISAGPGGGSRRRGAVRRDQAFAVVTVQGAGDGPELTMDLQGSDVDGGRALLDAVSERGWMPDDVEVTVDAAP